jgi:hypothetical protein
MDQLCPAIKEINKNDVMTLIKFLPHEYALGDKQVLILLSESHVHVCTPEKMTPRRYVHLGPEIRTEICNDIMEPCHIKHRNINNDYCLLECDSVAWMISTDISEEPGASVFRAEE